VLLGIAATHVLNCRLCAILKGTAIECDIEGQRSAFNAAMPGSEDVLKAIVSEAALSPA